MWACGDGRDAELPAGAIDDGFAERIEMGAALAAYAMRRDEESQEPFEWTLNCTRFMQPEPRVAALMQAIAADPGLSQQFVNLNQGLASLGDVVNGAVARIAASS